MRALRNLISEADLIIETSPPMPQNRSGAARENLKAALAIVDDLLKQTKLGTAAVALGSKGGSTTSKRFGPDHYRKMAAARKTKGGGRPRKHDQ